MAKDGEAPGIRAQLATAAVSGMCLNGRELLFGPSVHRDSLVARVRRQVRDMPDVVAKLDSMQLTGGDRLRQRPGLLGFVRRAAWCQPYWTERLS